MAKRFLTDINLSNNQLISSSFEQVASDPSTNLFEGRMIYNTTDELVKVYTTSNGWAVVGAITDVVNSDGNLSVSVDGAGVATVDLATSITADVTGDLTGNADTATFATTAGTANAVAADSVALGTDTTGDYVASVSGTDGVSITGTGEGAAVTIANSDKGSSQNIFKTVTDGTNNIAAASNNDTLTVSGTANEVTVDASTGDLVIGLPDDVTIGNNLTVTGDLTVSGTTTTVNTETINLADNIITLNSNFTGATPTENAGLEVERGDLANVVFRWNETTEVWEATTDGTNYSTVLLSGSATASDISDFNEAAQDAVGGILTDTSTIDFTYTDGSDTIEAAVILASGGGLTDSSGVAVDYSTVETQLVTDGFTKKVSANVGNGSSTSFVITHSLGTRDVTVSIYQNSAPYDEVEADVLHYDAADPTNLNKITVGFATAPTSNAYRVVVVG